MSAWWLAEWYRLGRVTLYVRAHLNSYYICRMQSVFLLAEKSTAPALPNRAAHVIITIIGRLLCISSFHPRAWFGVRLVKFDRLSLIGVPE